MAVAVALRVRASLALSSADAVDAAAAACSVVSRVANLQPEAALMARLGFAADVTATLVHFKDRAVFVSVCCCILRCLAAFPDAPPAAAWHSTLRLLTKVIRRHQDSTPAFAQAVGVLTQAAFRSAPLTRDAASTPIGAITR